jgi:ketosteroid isomerase-like protein
VTNDRIEAELDIRRLIAGLAVRADNGDIDDYVSLFTEDAVWEMPPNPATGLAAAHRKGRADIAEGVQERRAAGVQGPGSGTMHGISTQQIEVSGDDASGHVYYQFYGTRDGAPVLLTFGQYHDRYRRTTDGWKLAHRAIIIG